MSEAKPFCISKGEVWEAYKRAIANQGAAGADEQTIMDFERDLKGGEKSCQFRTAPVV